MENPELERKILEGQIRIKQNKEIIAHLEAVNKRIECWLNRKNVKPAAPAGGEPAMTEEDYTAEFKDLWGIYPSRHGVKAEKNAAYRRFKRMKKLDIKALKAACWNYARSDEARRGFARDMVRFLKDDYWPAWINPTEAMLNKGKDKKHGDAKPSSRAVDKIVSEITGRSNVPPAHTGRDQCQAKP